MGVTPGARIVADAQCCSTARSDVLPHASKFNKRTVIPYELEESRLPVRLYAEIAIGEDRRIGYDKAFRACGFGSDLTVSGRYQAPIRWKKPTRPPAGKFRALRTARHRTPMPSPHPPFACKVAELPAPSFFRPPGGIRAQRVSSTCGRKGLEVAGR